MAVLFVSHASRDDAAIRDLEAWLDAKGFTDRFVDHSDIGIGEKWMAELRRSVGACRAVLCFVTPAWLASDPCFEEFGNASLLGKRILPLFALGSGETTRPERLARVRAEDQGLDVSKWVTADGRLDLTLDGKAENKLEWSLRAAGALARIGLDPEAFAIEEKIRPTPFPGLASFGDEDADAAIFYGRSREIARSLDELRRMRARPDDRRPYLILGASGSGKSSLLKAGIIPRLRREAPAWLPLRAFRPGIDPLGNFADALARTLGNYGRSEAPGALRNQLLGAWNAAKRPSGMISLEMGAPLQAALEDIGGRLRLASHRPEATILVSLDQAEELARAEGESGDALAAYLRAAAALSRWRVVLTIRDDSWPEFNSHERFVAWEPNPEILLTVDGHFYDDVVEQPARRYGVHVAADLVHALMQDATGQDALPLLAYGLERLWHEFHANRELTLAQYEGLKRLGGLIQRGADCALAGLSPESLASPPSPSQSRVSLGKATFVPALVAVNEKRKAVRSIADWDEFGEEQKGLLADFVNWRLVVRRGPKVEVAHEALFREWALLESWLEPERARLDALRGLQAAATNWDANKQQAAYLTHGDKRLAEAEALGGIASFAKKLRPLDLAYLARCRAKERRSRAAIGTLVVALVLAVLGWMNQAFVKDQYDRFVYGLPYWWNHFHGHALTAEAERALRPGDSFQECDAACPKMIVVPAGEFMMGSPDEEKGRYTNEGPRHRVVIAHAFAVGVNDVTFDEWDACVAAGGCTTKAADYGMDRGNKPALGVSWDDARQYAAWLSAMTARLIVC
jgi:hypothetical protein